MRPELAVPVEFTHALEGISPQPLKQFRIEETGRLLPLRLFFVDDAFRDVSYIFQ